MSEHSTNNHGSEQHATKRREMTRRQFLSYTLGGAGAFMAGGVIIPMLRFAVDPILQPKSEGTFVKVANVDQITEEPASFTFKVRQVDGWHVSEPTQVAWIAKDENGNIFALSPVCKHLGCTVNWNASPQYPNEFFCPCHGAHYTKKGLHLAVATAPLDQYQVKIENGAVYLGPIVPNQLV